MLVIIPSKRHKRHTVQVKSQSRGTNRNKRELAPPPPGPSCTSTSFTTNMIRITNSVEGKKKVYTNRNDFQFLAMDYFQAINRTKFQQNKIGRNLNCMSRDSRSHKGMGYNISVSCTRNNLLAIVLFLRCPYPIPPSPVQSSSITAKLRLTIS